MRSVNSWIRRHWALFGLLFVLAGGGVVASPSVFNGSLAVPTSGTIVDVNATSSAVPVTNASHQYTYATAGNCITLGTTIAYSCASPTASPAPVATATNGITSTLYPGQSVGLSPVAPYSINANNSNATATPVPISFAGLASALSSATSGCPAIVSSFQGTSVDTSGTLTLTQCGGVGPSVLWVIVVGGGGGSSGTGATCGAGGNADNSTFGTSLILAGGGQSSTPCTVSTPGPTPAPVPTASAAAGPIALLSGGGGQGTMPGIGTGVSGAQAFGGTGGSNPFGMGGYGGAIGNGGAGGLGQGCGGGAGGAGGVNASGDVGSFGGAAGAYWEGFILAPSASYAYVAGKYGAPGSAGTGGSAGTHGAGGCVIVIQSWGTL